MPWDTPHPDLFSALAGALTARLDSVGRLSAPVPVFPDERSSAEEDEEILRRLMVFFLPRLNALKWSDSDVAVVCSSFHAIAVRACRPDWRFLDAFHVFYEQWPQHVHSKQRLAFTALYSVVLQRVLKQICA